VQTLITCYKVKINKSYLKYNFYVIKSEKINIQYYISYIIDQLEMYMSLNSTFDLLKAIFFNISHYLYILYCNHFTYLSDELFNKNHIVLKLI